MQPTLIVITGPTAVGKTKLAIDLALQLKAEIISTDSRQFFKEMTIGTAKPNQEELNIVPHHFINNCAVIDYYSAGDFERDALKKIEELFSKGLQYVIAVGGSGLYVKALCEGLDEMPEVDLELRNDIIANFELHGIAWLQEKLKALDTEKYARVDHHNPQRLMRAIELASQAPVELKPKVTRPFKIVKFGLEVPREELYDRINKRVDLMMLEGLLEEAKALHAMRHLNALQTVGYNELFDFFEEKLNLQKAVHLIKQHTRNYAKRQMTWFKADPNIEWVSPDNGLSQILNTLN